ncbi:MAG: PqqD family protein [Candidatus Aenigmarchaeota archaeon]|nr:PqqD family protein [Candidatus Aenigmarchaeota archaeon]
MKKPRQKKSAAKPARKQAAKKPAREEQAQPLEKELPKINSIAKLQRQGQIVKDPAGNLGLMKDGAAVRVDEVTASIWTMCDGKRSANDITGLISQLSSIPAEKIRKEIEFIIAQLQRLGFVSEMK